MASNPSHQGVRGHHPSSAALKGLDTPRLFQVEVAKTEVNGPGRHPLYAELTRSSDADGEAGDVQWNFEKFLIAPGGKVVNRFRPRTVPDAPEVVAAIEAVLPN
jgi:glutathione peroxidase-family protein